MFLRRLLFPFSWIYALITTVRNWMFDSGKLPSQSYPLPIISVGNITVGGTGKTPLVEHLIRLLQSNYSLALLSRGYGRKSKGVIIADRNSTYETIGDEPMQIKQKFPKLLVTVAEKRVLGMDAMLSHPQPPQIVLMDDAYQHRYVQPGFSILVTDYFRPMWKDLCFPAGNLREPMSGIKRAQVVVVNKCPKNLAEDEALFIQKKLKLNHDQHLLFSAIDYGQPRQLKGDQTELSLQDSIKKGDHLTVVAGIGNPQPFFNKAEQFSPAITAIQFKDHHHFTETDIQEIEKKSIQQDGSLGWILTTEKDAVRLSASEHLSDELASKIWYIPIQPMFLFDGENKFNELITNYIKE